MANNILAHFKEIDILNDIHILLDHDIFHSKDFAYYTYFMQNPHSIRISIDRSRIGCSNIIFEFDGSKRCTVCTNFSGDTYKTFNFFLYNDGSINSKETIREFRSFITGYLTDIANKHRPVRT